MKQLDDIRVWVCPYCRELIEIEDSFIDPTDHMLDHHRQELIRDKPQIKHDSRPRT